jgi:hypothetical protein
VIGGTAALVCLVFTLRAPKVARQVWHHIGARKVEGYAELIRSAAAESGLDPCLLAAVMYAESRGRVDAVSQADALGLLQLMESSAGDSAKRLGLEPPTRAALLADAELNVRLGANHLAWLLRTDGPDVERMLVAYNAGRTKLQRWIRAEGSWSAWRERHLAADDNGALRYAQDVLAFRDGFRERGVIVPPTPTAEAPPRLDVAPPPSATDAAAPAATGAAAPPSTESGEEYQADVGSSADSR